MALGSVRKLPSGKYQARYRVPAGLDYPEGLPRDVKAPHTFTTKTDAHVWLQEEHRSIRDGLWEHPAVRAKKGQTVAFTVGTWIEKWMQTKRNQRQSSFQTLQSIVRNRILNVDGDAAALRTIPLAQVKRGDVAEWWEVIQERFPDTASRNYQALQKLRAAMEMAVDHEVIPANPVRIKVSKPKGKRKRMPDDAEFFAVLERVPDEYKAAVCLCLFHGLRVGEALALKASEVIVTGEVPYRPQASVKINGNYQRVIIDGKATMVLHDPKTDAGWRTVPILAQFVPLIMRQKAAAGNARGALLTTTATGQVVFDTSLRSVFVRARDAAGVSADVHLHMGRDWLVTSLSERGASPAEIGKILGQADISTIVNVYMQVREARPPELMQQVGAVLDGYRMGVRQAGV